MNSGFIAAIIGLQYPKTYDIGLLLKTVSRQHYKFIITPMSVVTDSKSWESYIGFLKVSG